MQYKRTTRCLCKRCWVLILTWLTCRWCIRLQHHYVVQLTTTTSQWFWCSSPMVLTSMAVLWPVGAHLWCGPLSEVMSFCWSSWSQKVLTKTSKTTRVWIVSISLCAGCSTKQRNTYSSIMEWHGLKRSVPCFTLRLKRKTSIKAANIEKNLTLSYSSSTWSQMKKWLIVIFSLRRNAASTKSGSRRT